MFPIFLKKLFKPIETDKTAYLFVTLKWDCWYFTNNGRKSSVNADVFHTQRTLLKSKENLREPQETVSASVAVQWFQLMIDIDIYNSITLSEKFYQIILTRPLHSNEQIIMVVSFNYIDEFSEH